MDYKSLQNGYKMLWKFQVIKVKTSKTWNVNDVFVFRYLILLSNKMSKLIRHYVYSVGDD